jgi:hypothetical protein
LFVWFFLSGLHSVLAGKDRSCLHCITLLFSRFRWCLPCLRSGILENRLCWKSKERTRAIPKCESEKLLPVTAIFRPNKGSKRLAQPQSIGPVTHFVPTLANSPVPLTDLTRLETSSDNSCVTCEANPSTNTFSRHATLRTVCEDKLTVRNAYPSPIQPHLPPLQRLRRAVLHHAIQPLAGMAAPSRNQYGSGHDNHHFVVRLLPKDHRIPHISV